MFNISDITSFHNDKKWLKNLTIFTLDQNFSRFYLHIVLLWCLCNLPSPILKYGEEGGRARH